MLIFFPRLPNGNILWTCDKCGDTAEVAELKTNAVALYCICDQAVHPECNNRWYYDREYYK